MDKVGTRRRAHPGAHTYPARLPLSSPVSVRMQHRRESQVKPSEPSRLPAPSPTAQVLGALPREGVLDDLTPLPPPQ